MKLTRAGSDYHLAILLLAGVGILSGGTLFAALALALAFASLVSLALSKLRGPRSVAVRSASGPVKVLKGEEAKITLSVLGTRSPWATVEVESVRVDGPVEVSQTPSAGGGVQLVLRPRLEGRFSEMVATIVSEDALGLFRSTRTAKLEDAVLDSLPLSLVAPMPRVYIPPLVVGESPSGTAGKGQEFYGVEEYTEHSESKDILWRRAAKEPDSPLLARVREANSPEWVTIRVAHGALSPGQRRELVDLQCEALGTLGRGVILAGVGAEVVGPDGAVALAEDDVGLAEAVMRTSAAVEGPPAQEGTPAPDLTVVVGTLPEEEVIGLARRPTVFVGRPEGRLDDPFAVTFTGTEDLSGLLRLVLAR